MYDPSQTSVQNVLEICDALTQIEDLLPDLEHFSAQYFHIGVLLLHLRFKPSNGSRERVILGVKVAQVHVNPIDLREEIITRRQLRELRSDIIHLGTNHVLVEANQDWPRDHLPANGPELSLHGLLHSL